jgi:hypothetical protein
MGNDRRHRLASILVALALVCAGARPARAFCGFYVAGADAKLFNNATLVVLMREGSRTVLSMQNNYQGPPSDFAMIVPVPVVLQKENVKTLSNDVFERIDKLAAPRLVEYWEEDPCERARRIEMKMAPRAMAPPAPAKAGASLGVKIEAQFVVGEYEIVILSASDSAGLDTWLRQGGYKIPPGAEPVLRPYVQQGMKFFVAKVDVKKVRFEGDQALLSPLRFHFDSPDFFLPVRLGLLNSSGTQDLIVHVLGRGQRYEVANYDNVTIPTNLELGPGAAQRFGEFYVALFDDVMKKHPNAVVTEYAWASSSCDPCPTPPLSSGDVQTLGADALAPSEPQPLRPLPAPAAGAPAKPMRPPTPWMGGDGFVLTRLHFRYGKDSLGEDLVFRAAPPIVGGREHVVGAGGTLERGAVPSGVNNFQARYIIRHPWTGPITCKNPVRGVWGSRPAKPALKLAFTPRGKAAVGTFVRKGGLDVLFTKGAPLGRPLQLGAPDDAAPAEAPAPAPTTPAPAPTPTAIAHPLEPAQPGAAPSPADAVKTPPSAGGCGACALAETARSRSAAATMLLGAALACLVLRRSRRRFGRKPPGHGSARLRLGNSLPAERAC